MRVHRRDLRAGAGGDHADAVQEHAALGVEEGVEEPREQRTGLVHPVHPQEREGHRSRGGGVLVVAGHVPPCATAQVRIAPGLEPLGQRHPVVLHRARGAARGRDVLVAQPAQGEGQPRHVVEEHVVGHPAAAVHGDAPLQLVRAGPGAGGVVVVTGGALAGGGVHERLQQVRLPPVVPRAAARVRERDGAQVRARHAERAAAEQPVHGTGGRGGAVGGGLGHRGAPAGRGGVWQKPTGERQETSRGSGPSAVSRHLVRMGCHPGALLRAASLRQPSASRSAGSRTWSPSHGLNA